MTSTNSPHSSLSAKLEVKQVEELSSFAQAHHTRTRSIVAKAEIAAGELIGVEKPLASFLEKAGQNNH